MCKPKTTLMINTLLLILFFTTTCATKDNRNLSSAENFDWLIGEWERTNEKSGKTTIEKWKKITASEFHGQSYTLQNSDTIWQENVRLKKANQTWFYEVTPKGENKSTPFKLVKIGKETFDCENDLNDFPKKISYKRNGEKLFAEISGGDLKVLFEFKKLK